MKWSELVLSHGEENDGTAYPFWAIVTKAGLGGHVFHAGPWFSRASADLHLTNKKHRYPKTAFVYCFSGHMSWDYRNLMDEAKADLKPATEVA